MAEDYVAFQKIGGPSDRSLVKLGQLIELQREILNQDEELCPLCGSKMTDGRCPWCGYGPECPRFSEAAEAGR